MCASGVKALEYSEDHQSTTGLQLTHDQGTEWGKHFNLFKKKEKPINSAIEMDY